MVCQGFLVLIFDNFCCCCWVFLFRQKAKSPLPVPRSRAEIVLPQEYKETASGAPFLVYDSGEVEDRVLIFASAESFQLLASSKEWYSDGTFKTVPEQFFFQLYTLHGVCGEKDSPVCFLPDAQQEGSHLCFHAAENQRAFAKIRGRVSATWLWTWGKNALKTESGYKYRM